MPLPQTGSWRGSATAAMARPPAEAPWSLASTEERVWEGLGGSSDMARVAVPGPEVLLRDAARSASWGMPSSTATERWAV